MYNDYNTNKEFNPTLCSIGREKASSLISQALVVIKIKIEEKEEKEKKDGIAYVNSLSLSAEKAWSDRVNEYIKERNGVKGNFFKCNWRKLLIFLNMSELMTLAIAEENQKINKSTFIEAYIGGMTSNYCYSYSPDFCMYHGHNPLYYDQRRLEKLRDAVEKSDSISLSISDMNIIFKYIKYMEK